MHCPGYLCTTQPYDENGTQICHHHSLNTVRCRKMRRGRLAELREKLGDGVPLNIRPAYRNVEELRHECALRGMVGSKKISLASTL